MSGFKKSTRKTKIRSFSMFNRHNNTLLNYGQFRLFYMKHQRQNKIVTLHLYKNVS